MEFDNWPYKSSLIKQKREHWYLNISFRVYIQALKFIDRFKIAVP